MINPQLFAGSVNVTKDGEKKSFFFTFAGYGFFMNHRIKLFALIVISSAVISCRVARQNTVPGRPDLNAATYINTYKELAISEMRRSGIPASITLAQGMIESDFGRSTLARTANNHFGIKCHDGWKGATVRHHDDRRNECFRKYTRPEDSFFDHSEFLRTGSRYSFLFNLDQTDYKGWARGLKKAGYATNPDYANMLIRKIEENDLQYLDRGKYISGKNAVPVFKNVPSTENDKELTVPRSNEASAANNGEVNTAGRVEGGLNPPDSDNVAVNGLGIQENITVALPARIMERNRVQYIIVKEGDTRESIENEFNLLRWELAKYNELDPDFKPVQGQILFLQPKRDKAESGSYYYFAAEGDTMYKISQNFGIRLKKLYEMNRMSEGTQPVANQKIWLRTVKPVYQR